MKYRLIATVILSAAFLVLMITGILMYSTQYDYFTASLHIWASILSLIGVCWHFKNNWLAYKKHLSFKQGKVFLLITLLGVMPVSFGLIAELAPFHSVIQFGERLRSAGTVKPGEFAVVDLTHNHENSNLEIFVKAGSHYHSEPQPLALGMTYTSVPQMAIWLEDMEGNYVKTLYVTSKTSNSSFRNKPGQTDIIRRPEALPVWGHKRGVRASDGLYVPDVDSLEFDGLTAATPKTDHQIRFPKVAQSQYRIFMEVNRSYDFNEYYTTDRFPSDPIYSGSGSSGQPSLVYSAVIDTAQQAEALLSPVGHGHHSGQNGDIYEDLTELTTAKALISFAVVKTSGS